MSKDRERAEKLIEQMGKCTPNTKPSSGRVEWDGSYVIPGALLYDIRDLLASRPEEKEESGYIDDNILQSAIDTWGFDAQCEMILEESIELALALQKMKRVRGDKQQKFDNLIDGLADVKIMIRQAERLFPIDIINKRIDFKMNRLKERLNEKIA